VRSARSLQRFGGDAALAIGAGIVANAFSYVFHFIISRQLGPDRYGTLLTLMAVGTMLSVLGNSMGTVAMQETARMWASHLEDAIAPFLRRTSVLALGVALAAAVVLVIASLFLGQYVHVTALLLWLLLAADVAVAFFAAYARGAAQGAHRFGVFALSLVSEGAAKVVIACALVAMAFEVAGALTGLLCSVAIGCAIAYVPLAGRGGSATWAQGERLRLGGETMKVLGITAATNVLLLVDMLFAKHQFTGVVAGYFGAAGTLARTIPFGVGLISLVIMPKAAAAKHESAHALAQVVRLAAVGAVAATAAGVAILAVFGAPIIALTFGSAFAPASTLIRLYAFDEALMALWLMPNSYLVAIAQYDAFPYLVAVAILEAACFGLFGATPHRLLTVAIAANAILVPIMWLLVLRTLRAQAQAPRPAGAETLEHLP
jgi:O-antigen/teichoic acid export membrane protein